MYLIRRIATGQTVMVNFMALLMAAKIGAKITLTFEFGVRCIALAESSAGGGHSSIVDKARMPHKEQLTIYRGVSLLSCTFIM